MADLPSAETAQREWWITTEFFNHGGIKVMGPFVSRDLAMQVRTLRETVEGHNAYFVDSEVVSRPEGGAS